jgi:hypothetical protein
MAEITVGSGLIGERARVVEDFGDKLKPVDDPSKPKDDLADLADWVMNHARQWRDHRKQNYELSWDQYERLWRGLWSGEDKNKKSERSTLVTPALAEAVENIVAEVEEAMFGRGDLFDLKGENEDAPEMKAVTDRNKNNLKEDLQNTEFTTAVGEALINAAVYGSGIGEIFVKKFKLRDIVSSVQAMQPGVPPEMQVIVKEVTYSYLQSVNPRNFLIDPIARTIDTALGCAVEEYVGAHIIRAGQKSGDYRKVDIGTHAGDMELGPDRQVENEYVHDKVHVIRYYGLVPEHLLFPKGEVEELFPKDESKPLGMYGEPRNEEIEEKEVVEELMPADEAVSGKKSVEPIDSDMVEAIVILANESVCIKAVRTPYLMEDRPLVSFPWDIVPGRFWGRGVCEKGQVPQRVMDAEMRARIDALAYISAPMMAMDASKLPRGFQLTVKPGKSILTNGDPKNILNPIHFGQLDQSTFQHSQQLDQMIQRATGSLDVISLAAKAGGDARPGAVSMMLSGIVKRHKRTLMGFIDRFYVPALRKMMWRNMQFYPERYTPLNWTFTASNSMGILQREYESQQLVSLMQTMEPQSKEYKILLMGVVSNTGLTHRAAIMKMIEESISNAAAMEQAQTQQATDPLQAQMQQVGMQYQIAKGQAEIAELGARTRLQDAKARNEALEPRFKALDVATKGIYQVQQDQQQAAFDRRMQVADRALKLKDIDSNERIAKIQSGQSVKSEAIKTAGAIASERVRARAEHAKARADERSRARESHSDERSRARESMASVGAAKASAKPQPVPMPIPVPVPQRPFEGRQAELF